MGEGLVLQCPNHRDVEPVVVYSSSDFDRAPHGGCTLPCSEFLLCGHQCRLSCHAVDHKRMFCSEPCSKDRPAGCIHPCSKPCGEDCPPCPVRMKKIRNKCRHESLMACSKDPNKGGCNVKCGAVPPCGHPCEAACHPSGVHDSINVKCLSKCTRTRQTCTHACPLTCSEPCGDCVVLVDRSLSCGHVIQVRCCDATSVPPPPLPTCISPCSRTLRCGHKCTLTCDALCTVDCAELVTVVRSACASQPHC